MLRLPLRCLAPLLLLCNLAFAAPAPADDAAIPPVLRDWRGWVLKDLDFRACPFLATQMQDDANGHICAWPGRLKLDADANGAAFALHWRVDAPSWVALPGDAQHWPQQVKVNGQAQPVLDRAGSPALWLTPGGYDVVGAIAWRERPQSLRVPGVIGLVALSVDGKAVAPVQRDGDEVTLGRSAAAALEADSVELHVFRRLTDGVPALLTTQVRFSVAGQAREEVFGPVLPDGFVATALSGDWSARLDNDGRLHVQVQPGAATLTLDARAIAPLAQATAHLPAAPWSKQEIWSYASAPRLRATNATASVSVDPQQAQVPTEWQNLPAFALGDGDKITIEERSRGLSPGEANRLTLRREAWLDFAGGGWYAKDAVAGSMVQGWRLDVAAPFKLERADAAAASGRTDEALLVTRGAGENLSGVEWRTPNVNLAGSVRIDAVSNLPAAGWQQTFDRIDTTLHFPYGYKLLGAPGADRVEGSWMSRWTLLDVFVAAIVALLAWRLLGVFGALAAAAYLALGYQESGSPLWTLVAVLALALILRALPAGKLQSATLWLRRAAMLALVLVALPFVADQVRYALYPQLEEGGGAGGMIEAALVAPAGAPADYAAQYRHKLHRAMPAQEAPASANAPAPPPVMASEAAPMATPMPSPAPRIIEKQLARSGAKLNADASQSIVVSGSVIAKSALIDHYSQSTVMQTGAGEPAWNIGSTAQLGWSGPVTPAQSVHLVVAPPWLVRPLRLVLVALLAWLAWSAWRGRPQLPRVSRTAAAGVAALLIATSLCAVPAAHAQGIPSDELLNQLRERLTEAPKCAPACASVAQMQLSAAGDAVTATLEVHAGERLAVPLPRIDANVTLKSAKVDSVADALVARAADGGDWIALDRGVHRVELTYAAHADRIALNFTLVPARALFEGQGWSASGIEDDRLLGGSVSLARVRTDAGAKPELGAQQFPPYVRVVRSLALGLDWSVRSEAQRLSPATGGITVELPLLAGEHVSTPGMKVQNSSVTVAIADGAAETAWSGTLDKADTLSLTAPALGDRAEVWRVLVSPTWHAEFSGVPGVGLDAGENANDYRNFEFHPLPGETLTVKITRPAPSAGATRAIDAVALSSAAGQRSATHTLAFTLRASQGGEQTITLPAGAEVTAVQRDGETLGLRARDGKLALPVKPGVQRYRVDFRSDDADGFVARTPAVALGLPAANIALSQQLPADRWLLASSGPAVGPAVLYWGELLVLIAVAWALTRTRRTQLKFRDWLLLGLGFSTSSWLALIVFAAWLFAFDWRARCETKAPWWRFDLVQIGLAVLTVVALVALVSTIKLGLLGAPDMHVVGNGSSASSLAWFADRAADALPQASAYSLPLWVYKVLMLAWALWLANALIGWLRAAWTAWTRGGYWQARPEVPRAPADAAQTETEKT